jgi:hypothetical protein
VLAANGEPVRIIPGAVVGLGAQAWVGDKNADAWLTQGDLDSLARLWPTVDLESVVPRVKKAFWLHEYLARTEELAIRWILASAGIEALVNTSMDRASKQFIVRMVELARRFSEREISRTQASKIYEKRSSILHGTTLASAHPDDLGLYLCLEATLRDILRSVLADHEAQALFVSADSIDQAWPME